jgi:LysM repeat protein
MNMPTSQNTRIRNLSKKRSQLKEAATKRKPRRAVDPHRLPAHLTREEQWETDAAPAVKTSRMFVAMLSLHLVAVGGLVAFHFFGHDPAPQMLEKTASSPTATTGKPVAPAAQSKPAIPSPTQPAPAAASFVSVPNGYREHVVRIDETWDTIANTFSIAVNDLQAANPGIDCNVGRRLLVPPQPQVITAAGKTATTTSEPSLYRQPDEEPGSAMTRYAINPATLPPAVTTPKSDLNSSLPKPSLATTTAPKTTIGGPVKANVMAPASTARVHIISKGETLFGIAKKRGISEKVLMRHNGISDASKIQPGQKLKIPSAQ